MEVDNGDASSSDGGHSLDEQDDKLFPIEGEKDDEAPRAARWDPDPPPVGHSVQWKSCDHPPIQPEIHDDISLIWRVLYAPDEKFNSIKPIKL